MRKRRSRDRGNDRCASALGVLPSHQQTGDGLAEYLSPSTAESCRHKALLRRTSLRFSQREVSWGTLAPGSAGQSRGRSERARKARSHGDLHASILEPDRLTQALRVASLSTWSGSNIGPASSSSAESPSAPTKTAGGAVREANTCRAPAGCSRRAPRPDPRADRWPGSRPGQAPRG